MLHKHNKNMRDLEAIYENVYRPQNIASQMSRDKADGKREWKKSFDDAEYQDTEELKDERQRNTDEYHEFQDGIKSQEGDIDLAAAFDALIGAIDNIPGDGEEDERVWVKSKNDPGYIVTDEIDNPDEEPDEYPHHEDAEDEYDEYEKMVRDVYTSPDEDPDEDPDETGVDLATAFNTLGKSSKANLKRSSKRTTGKRKRVL